MPLVCRYNSKNQVKYYGMICQTYVCYFASLKYSDSVLGIISAKNKENHVSNNNGDIVEF